MTGFARAAQVAERLATARERIRVAAELAGRDPTAVRVVAVTKGQPVGAVGAAIAAGLHDIGESRVQEAEAKRSVIADATVRWHMIGHLQRNKARAAAVLFDSLHSLDSVALAAALSRARVVGTSPLEVFIEVELTGLPGRSGVAAPDAAALLDAVLGLDMLSIVGLMTVAAPGSAETAADCFGRLRTLRDRLRESHGAALAELSMGMSDDFEAAVTQGATIVRLGRVLFGDRPEPGH